MANNTGIIGYVNKLKKQHNEEGEYLTFVTDTLISYEGDCDLVKKWVEAALKKDWIEYHSVVVETTDSLNNYLVTTYFIDLSSITGEY